MFEQLTSLESSLPHACLLVGDRDSIHNDLARWLQESRRVSVDGNPNVITMNTVRFGIEDARRLKDLQSKTGVGEHDSKVFIVLFDSATSEAQNALLKSIEEPTPGTQYFFIVPSLNSILPTVLSRLLVLNQKQVYDDIHFLPMSLKERTSYCEQFYGDNKKNIAPDRAEVALFIDRVLHELFARKDAVPEWTEHYRAIEQLRTYTTDRSSSLKYICEYVSTTLPVLSK